MRQMSLKVVIPLSILAVILLLVFSFSYWLNANIFNKQNFINKTVDVIERQEVRNAISAEIVDQAFADLPLIRETVGDFAQSSIAGLLGSRAVQPVLRAAAGGINNLITSPNPKAVTIDTSGVSRFIIPIATAVNKQLGTQINTGNIPKSLTLLEKGQIPSIYSWGIVLLWVGPIAGIIGLGLIIAMIWMAKPERRRSVLKAIGMTLVIGGIITNILMSMLESPILAGIQSENIRVVASNIYRSFAGSFIFQNWILVAIGVLVVASGYILPYALGWIAKVLHVRVPKAYTEPVG